MPISVTCNACKKQFNVPDHYAGKTGKCTQCGAPITAPASAPPNASDEQLREMGGDPKAGVTIGSTLAGYKLQKRLGAERSSVFLAQGEKGPVAIKVLPREITEKNPTAAKRFLREARSLFGIEHPNVVTCFDAGEELGTLYLVMELFGGRTLKELMAERGGKVPPAEGLDVALQVARGLQHLHEQKLVHRNLKPEHILVGPDGTVKIVGLGLIKSSEPEQALTMKGVAVGTPQYMSPEQARGETEVDGRSDLWSLGVTMFEMLAGELPWINKAPLKLLQMIDGDPPPPLQQKNPQVSPTAVMVVEKLLAKKKEERYQTPADLARDLEALKNGQLVEGKPPSFVAGGAVAKSAARGGATVAGAPAASGSSDALVKKLLFAVVGLGVLVVALLVVVVVLLLKR